MGVIVLLAILLIFGAAIFWDATHGTGDLSAILIIILIVLALSA